MFRFEKDKSCLFPIDLFEIEVDIPFSDSKPKRFSSYELPDFSDLFYSSNFAKLGLYYNQKGLGGTLLVEAPFTSSEYPDYTKGDALELFISLKPVSSMSSVSRFCHHFVIFPVEIGGFYAKEMTHFRHDDTRPLFDPVHIDMEVKFDKKSYTLDFFIHKDSLYGFDDRGETLSFTYAIYSPKKGVQYFSCSADNFSMSQGPSLWASGLLKN
jgi:hypothetical protein